MKLSDIDLSNIKVVIFDFDDTLAIHKDKYFTKTRRETEEKFLEFYKNAYQNPAKFYEEIEPCEVSEVLFKLINELREKNIKMYCLSGMKFSFHLKAKQYFLDKHYGKGIEVLCTSSQELKLIGVKILSKIEECKLDEMLLIDDRKDVIESLKDMGAKAILVNDIEL